MENTEEEHLEPELLSIKRYYHIQKKKARKAILTTTALISSFCQTHHWFRTNGKRVKVKSSYHINSFSNSSYTIKT